MNAMANGARFYKADLHIHSYGIMGGSYDVVDITNTPAAIIDTAIGNGISIISITDHNEILNSIQAVQSSEGKPILVIPGVELSTTQGHLLVYFENIGELRSYYGQLTFNNEKSICYQSIKECLDKAAYFNGIGILAHIGLDSGFEKTIGRYGAQMDEIFKCSNLLGLEITRKEESDMYTDSDSSDDRKRLLGIWRTLPTNQTLHQSLAKLMSSDSHELSRLGQNAEGNRRLTRIRMNSLTFRSFRNALLSAESRVLLEDYIPDQRPLITKLKLDGGLLDKIDIEISPNLTCIIGGRGAGKSTMLESVMACCGQISGKSIIDSEVWPQTISLQYTDEANQSFTFQRDKNGEVINRTNPTEGITSIPIESYGQGDTAETIQHSDDKPQVLVDFLDKFVDVSPLRRIDETLCSQLRENSSSMTKLKIELTALPECEKALANERKKMENLTKEKAGEIVKYQNALVQERAFRKSLIDQLNKLVSTYRDILGNTYIFDEIAQMSDDQIIVGKDYFSKVKEVVNSFASIVSLKSEELNKALTTKINELKEQLKLWNAKESEIQSRIDAKKEEFQRLGIPFDLGKINQISKDIIDYDKRVKELKAAQTQLSVLVAKRKELIDSRRSNSKEILRQHLIFESRVNESLKNSVDDFSINLKYSEGLLSSNFETTLKDIMGWRTSQVPKAKFISRQMNVLDFVDAVKTKNRAILQQLKDADGHALLSPGDIDRIISTLLEGCKYEELESISYDDLPTVTVTKFIDNGGRKTPVVKKLAQLSLGQQQSVLLSILLLSDSTKPLLIDQPEDNLDSEFIYKTIVANLRKIKEKRQVIIVTHNPNIAVLGDAELIIPLKSTNNRSFVMSPGSVDDDDTMKMCCQILEGGESAFKQRKQLYHF